VARKVMYIGLVNQLTYRLVSRYIGLYDMQHSRMASLKFVIVIIGQKST